MPQRLFDSEVQFKLKEAQLEAKTNNTRLTQEEVFSSLREELRSQAKSNK